MILMSSIITATVNAADVPVLWAPVARRGINRGKQTVVLCNSIFSHQGLLVEVWPSQGAVLLPVCFMMGRRRREFLRWERKSPSHVPQATGWRVDKRARRVFVEWHSHPAIAGYPGARRGIGDRLFPGGVAFEFQSACREDSPGVCFVTERRKDAWSCVWRGVLCLQYLVSSPLWFAVCWSFDVTWEIALRPRPLLCS